MIESYYDDLAPYYRYLFPDWEKSVIRQAKILDGLIQEYFGAQARRLLDAACGIGTQTIGLAQLGYTLVASDISAAELEAAAREAQRRSLKVEFYRSDMRALRSVHQGRFDVVLALDNAIPHLLSEADILLAFEQFYACAADDGGCMLSVRDYARMERSGRQFYPRTVHQTAEGRVILFDIWDYDGDYYDFTTYVVEDQGEQGVCTQAIRGGRYFCVSIATLERLLRQAGFERVVVELEKFYQPILIGLKGAYAGRA